MDRDHEEKAESGPERGTRAQGDRKPTLLHAIEVIEALQDKQGRAAVLKRFLIFEAKWLLAGVLLCTVVDAGEAWQKRSVAAAWNANGTWWLLVPFIFPVIPIAYVSFILLGELAIWLLSWLIYALPSKLFKSPGTWGTILKWSFLLGFIGFIVFACFGLGRDISTSSGTPEPPPATAVPPNPAGDATPWWNFDWQAWISHHALLYTLMAPAAVFFLKALSTEYIKGRFKNWTDPKAPSAQAPKETHVLYGPDNRVVRTFEIDKNH